MDRGIGGIVKLLRHEKTGRIRLLDFFCLAHGASHAFGAGRQNQGGTQHGQHATTLDRHRLRHGQRQFVAACGSDVCQGDARVTRGRLDDFNAGFQHAAFLRIPDHRRTDAAFHRIGRIAAFDLGEHAGPGAGRDAIELHKRGAADGLAVVSVDGHGDFSVVADV